ncbi:FkbM family methyltransferase [Bauldia litoralis]|uniref:Methyltransferase, FkbM family n=1 Tax=Bauldia litoralis TaxID=665467 RepID=A0A1G6CVX6_9HYPH|nr:FkbM family methyltransferase [Bauldia litoralis]SDB37039.1 methyltransferase, FkbM family [Bauldia litoralis]
MKIAFFPPFRDAATLTNHFYRLHWYLYPFASHVTQITLLHEKDAGAVGVMPDFFDSEVASLVGKLPVSLVPMEGAKENLEAALSTADIILVWSSDALGKHKKLGREKKIFRIDHDNDLFAASHYLRIATLFVENQANDVEVSKTIFEEITRLCSSDVGYIFGTGPNLAQTEGHDFADGVSIACNSMVRNRPLLERLRPPLFVVGDPIFHAGCSSYAAKFRAELVEAMDRYGSFLIVPLRDYHIYKTYLPARFSGRIAALPFKTQDLPNLDLRQEYCVTSTANVLTLFLIPLAATFFKEIRISGCDGKRFAENKYFWGHDKASQINEEMDRIQNAHPSFFTVSYDDYYKTHCQVLERWLKEVEARGIQVCNMTQSYIPALVKRSIDKYADSDVPRVSIIMPAKNVEQYIDEAVESILKQGFGDFEVLAIDDASTDGTLAKLEAWAMVDYRVRVLSNQRSPGVSGARNTGLDAARGEYIAFLDGDDTWLPHALESQVQALAAENAATFVHGKTRIMDETLSTVIQELATRRTVTFDDADHNPTHLNACLIPGALIGGLRFDEDRQYGEDWLFVARLLRTGATSKYQDRTLATYRVRKGSATTNDILTHERALVSVVNWIFDPCQDESVHPDFRSGLRGSDRDRVLGQRKLKALGDAVILVRVSEARTLLGELKNEGLLEAASFKPNDRYFDLSIRRLLGVSISDAPQKTRPNRDEMAKLIKSIELDRLAPAFVRSLWEAVHGEDWRTGARIEKKTASLESIEFQKKDDVQLDEVRLIFDLIGPTRPDGVMIDVGAHFGGSLGRFARIGWTIYGFEPDPANRSKLLEAYGSSSNIILSEEAVSDSTGEEVPFFASEESTGISGLSAFRDTHHEVARVKTVTLDDVAARHQLSHVDFLKIDVEGFEMAVLRGLDFGKLAPDIVLAEFEDGKTKDHGYTVVDLCAFFGERGYVVYISEWYPIQQYGVTHSFRRLRRYPCDIPADAWGNLLAFRTDPSPETLTRAYQHGVGRPLVTRRKKRSAKGRNKVPTKRFASDKTVAKRSRRGPLANFVRSMPISTAAIVASLAFLLVTILLPSRAGAAAFVELGPWVVAAVIGLVAYEHLRRRMRKQAFSMRRQSIRRAARQKQEIRKVRNSLRAVRKSDRKRWQASREKIASMKTESGALRKAIAEGTTARGRLERQVEALTRGLDKIEKQELPASSKAAAFLHERVVAGERQIEAIRYPDAPACIVFLGHHKCGSRFFRKEVFGRVSEMTGAKIREYKIANPPFHYSRMDDLDLCNMDFDNIGAVGRDVVLFANASARSLEKLREVALDWKAIRVVRDPRQVLVSDYFHHKSDHSTESSLGWVWDTLKRDKPILLKLPKEEGLLYELDHITKEVIEDEILGPFDDERILTLKLEEFAAAPRLHLVRISEFLEIADIAGIDLGNTFANGNSGYWGDHFTPKLKAVFKERYGQALIDLGYERDMDW